jgi:hypothetical protein
MAGTELMRANRVAVKANGENFVADFYRTHKAIGSIHSELTDWNPPQDATNKSAARESFRQWAIANAADFNIDWKPQDMRAESNIRRPRYTTDQELIDDATSMVMPEMKALVDKCKYGIEWGGVQHEDIVPLTHTGSGRDLTTMGIINGKYKKSGNWAWAEVIFMTVFRYKKEECYIKTVMQLVSGQLKKTGIGITEFNNRVKAEIIDAGLATAEELDPPKETKKKSKEDKPKEDADKNKLKVESMAQVETPEQETPVKEDVKPEEPKADTGEQKPKRKRTYKKKSTEASK